MDKSLEVLQARRNELYRRIENDQHQMKEIDKQIEAIENGPVRVDDWVKSYIYENPLQHTSDCGIPINDDLRLGSAFQAGEQNDRKRTQPLIDKAKSKINKALRMAPELYSSIDVINLLEEALKTLEENEI